MNNTGEEEEEIKWIPTITLSDLRHNGMRVNFHPPYPGADSHRICAQINMFTCAKELFRVQMPSVSEFIEIPSNRTYRILVRPYDENDDHLYKWMPASGSIFLPPFDTELSTIHIPVESPGPGPGPGPGENITENTPTDTSEFFSQPANIALIASLSCLAVILLISIALYKFLKRDKQSLYNLKIEGDPESRGPVKITPLYLHDSTGMVEAHLEILEKQPDITLERVNVDQMNGNIENWINTQINSLSKHDNHEVLIYASENMEKTLDMFPEKPEDQICVRFMQKLCENQNIKPYVVCFGEEVCLKGYPPVIQAIKYKSDGSVSFDGTLELIRQILSIKNANGVSLDSAETRDLQTIFNKCYHSVNM